MAAPEVEPLEITIDVEGLATRAEQTLLTQFDEVATAFSSRESILRTRPSALSARMPNARSLGTTGCYRGTISIADS